MADLTHIDNQGRVRIPQPLRELAGIDPDQATVGALCRGRDTQPLGAVYRGHQRTPHTTAGTGNRDSNLVHYILQKAGEPKTTITD